jgi:hypothetical protein
MGSTTATGNWNCVCGSRSQMRSSAFHGNSPSSYDGRGEGKMRRSTGDVNSVFSSRVTPGAQAGGGPLPMAAARQAHATPALRTEDTPERQESPAGGQAARAARGEVANGCRLGGGSKLRRAPLASEQACLRSREGRTWLECTARARSKAVVRRVGSRAAPGCRRRESARFCVRRFSALAPSAAAQRRTRFSLLARRSERDAARSRRCRCARCVAVGARWRGGAAREEARRLAPRARHAGRRAPRLPGLPRAFDAAGRAKRGQQARAAAEKACLGSAARAAARC